ncbi:hypothetical protein ABBQ38_004533 [Trebouxia sp. C0009 RCD-2024]
MSFTEPPAPQKQAAHEQQHVVDDFEAEFLADLEETDDQDVQDSEQSPCKRRKHEAPRTPDVSDTTWNRQTGLLGQLPPEVVLRLFGFLSAEDLAVSAQACRYLASLSSQDELWKRLYCARWCDAGTKPILTSSWKAAYISKDGIEISEVLSGVSEPLQPLYKEMAVSKRSLSLGRGYVGQGAQAVASRHRHSPVAQWRVENGLPEAPDADHACAGRCSFINIIDNVYICEQCGREHVCDESCKERVLDTANGMPVCPISGMCFDQLDVAWEVTFQNAVSCPAVYCASELEIASSVTLFLHAQFWPAGG